MLNFFLCVSFIVFVKVRIFPLNMRDIIIYVARWWEKYLSKRSLLKHTFSLRDKLIVLWILNRQAKMFLRISNKVIWRIWIKQFSILSKFSTHWSTIYFLNLFLLNLTDEYPLACDAVSNSTYVDGSMISWSHCDI